MARYDWKELYDSMDGCTKCRLCEQRNSIVIGEGDPSADIMFVGEPHMKKTIDNKQRSINCKTKVKNFFHKLFVLDNNNFFSNLFQKEFRLIICN